MIIIQQCVHKIFIVFPTQIYIIYDFLKSVINKNVSNILNVISCFVLLALNLWPKVHGIMTVSPLTPQFRLSDIFLGWKCFLVIFLWSTFQFRLFVFLHYNANFLRSWFNIGTCSWCVWCFIFTLLCRWFSVTKNFTITKKNKIIFLMSKLQ